jgi:hypothetical protein
MVMDAFQSRFSWKSSDDVLGISALAVNAVAKVSPVRHFRNDMIPSVTER